MNKSSVVAGKVAGAILMLLMCAATVVFAAPNVNGLNSEGEVIASIGFDPKINGFGFRNFGENPDYEDDLTADDLIRMFGAENVCIEGSTARDCVLYETAERWLEESVDKMNNGHCDGFSVSSLRMFLGKPFKGRKSPAEFQRGATKSFRLAEKSNHEQLRFILSNTDFSEGNLLFSARRLFRKSRRRL